jgi:preprotein translocase subunit SecD
VATAEENFHKLLGIDFDGMVVSAPLIQPTQSSFSSFDGQGSISGNFTKPQAMALAKALHHG